MTSSLLVAGFLSLLASSEEAPKTPPATPAEKSVAAAGAQDDAAADAADAAVDEGPQYPDWKGNVDVGIVQKQGNTQSINGTAAAKIVGELEEARSTFFGWWLYEDDEGTITERKYGGRGKYDYFFTEKRKNYVYGIGQLGTDLAANVDYRWFLGTGVGWVWNDDEKWRLSTDLGVSYLQEEFRDGTDDDKGNYTFIYDLFWQLQENMDYNSDFVGQMSMTDSDDVLLQWIHQIHWNISKNFTTGFRYVLDWDNTPAAGSKRDDHILAFTLGYAFD